jgi:DNA-binding NarL/FixJ family response regulator
MIRLVVADDHPIVRWGLVTLLGEQPGAEVVGEATDGFEAIELTRTLRPDVVVLDVSMPGCNGIKATSLLHRTHSGVRVVLVSALGWPSMPRAARLAGAHRYVAKSAPAAELLDAVFG